MQIISPILNGACHVRGMIQNNELRVFAKGRFA